MTGWMAQQRCCWQWLSCPGSPICWTRSNCLAVGSSTSAILRRNRRNNGNSWNNLLAIRLLLTDAELLHLKNHIEAAPMPLHRDYTTPMYEKELRRSKA